MIEIRGLLARDDETFRQEPEYELEKHAAS